MKKRKWFCLFLSVIFLFAGCGGTVNEMEDMSGSGRYDLEITEETPAFLLQSGETILWAQYFEGERIWFLENDADQLICYHEDKEERELLLEHVPAVFTGCSLYMYGENFYACQMGKLTVLDAGGKEVYTIDAEGRIQALCMSRDGSIVLAVYDDDKGTMLKTLDRESGTLSGGIRLSDFFGIGTGTERGILVIDRIGAYDLDMESGEKCWHMKWNGTSYIPTYEKFFVAAQMGEDGTLERIERDKKADIGRMDYAGA